MANKTLVDTNFNGDFEIIINNGSQLQYPIVEDGVKWETDRQGSPGKLTFKLYKTKNSNLNFQEGDGVLLRYKDSSQGWTSVFEGYVFTKKRSKDDWIEVTAYDQLRYLKNKATYVYTNKKASDVVKMIAKDYKLNLGTIENTAYVIGSRVEDNQSLFDIVQNALDLTLVNSKKQYVLFSDNGKIHLRNIDNMRTDIVINDAVAEDFDYSSSIDEQTYNEIELFYDNDETKKREYYNAQDPVSMSKWGRLRYTENIKSTENIKYRTTKMLELYNRKSRKLDVKKAFGDFRCRAGASVIVKLDLGDITVSNYMVIEHATHTFSKNEYRMDLKLDGFNVDDGVGSGIYNTSGVVKQSTQTTSKKEIPATHILKVNINTASEYAGSVWIRYNHPSNSKNPTDIPTASSITKVMGDRSRVMITVTPKNNHSFIFTSNENITKHPAGKETHYTFDLKKDTNIEIRWVR